MLYFPGANHIATRSYAMYLLHPEALAALKRFGPNLPFLVYFGLTLLITFCISEFLYRIVEKPFMDLREKHQLSKRDSNENQ